MIDFQQKRQFKKIIYSKITLLILLITIIIVGRGTYNIYEKSRLSVNNFAAVESDYKSLKARKDMLESEINRLKTDNGIEEEIRSKFNVAKPGETVVTIINSSNTPTNTENSTKGFWSNFWSFFSTKGGSASGGK
ncbi:MAG: septum formation initiator family protein [bacterium]